MIWPDNKFTRFEVARLLGARSLQVSLGAPVLIETDKKRSIDIAKEEFKGNIIPITIKRTLPNNTNVAVNAKDAIKDWVSLHGGEV